MSDSALRRTKTIAIHLFSEPTSASPFDRLSGGKAISSEDERKEFEAIFNNLLNDVLRELPTYGLPEHAKEWIKRLLVTVVPGGKLNRGLTVLHSFAKLTEHRQLSRNEVFKAQVLGWCVELLQAFFLVADDLMDQSVTRRGVPCWYRQPHPMGNSADETIGSIAVNDSFILESLIYKILRKYFRQEKYYADLLDLFMETSFQTEIGQLLDLTSNLPGGRVDLNLFTIENYRMIVKYKTAYYSFYLPMALAMMLAGINSKPTFQIAEDILIPMGEYFQIQDDYLDCYGDPAVIGKVGRDIEENKCSWLVVQALRVCNPEQRKLLDKHYGRDNAADVAIVKKLYKELNLEKIYKEYEDASYKQLTSMIKEVRSLPQEVFIDLLGKIYKRKL